MTINELKADLILAEGLTQEIASDAIAGSEDSDPVSRLEMIEQRSNVLLDILDILRIKIAEEGLE